MIHQYYQLKALNTHFILTKIQMERKSWMNASVLATINGYGTEEIELDLEVNWENSEMVFLVHS